MLLATGVWIVLIDTSNFKSTCMFDLFMCVLSSLLPNQKFEVKE